jgi:hypothetical protein
MLMSGSSYNSCFLTSLDVASRNNNRQDEIKELTSKGIIPHDHELEKVSRSYVLRRLIDEHAS